MSITVRELLRLPHLRLALTAGAAGLAREVSWVHSSDLPDPWAWLGPAELLLTNGTSLSAEERTQVAYIDRLAEAGASGLGIGVGMPGPPLSAAAVQRCDELALPLLAVPYSVPFTAVTRAVADANGREEAHLLGRVAWLYELLRTSVTEERPAAEMFRKLGEELGVRLYLADPETGQSLLGDGEDVPFAAALRAGYAAHGNAIPGVLRLRMPRTAGRERAALAVDLPGDQPAALAVDVPGDQPAALAVDVPGDQPAALAVDVPGDQPAALAVDVPGDQPAALVAEPAGSQLPSLVLLHHIAIGGAVELARLAAVQERQRRLEAGLLGQLLERRADPAPGGHLIADAGLDLATSVLAVTRSAGEQADAGVARRLTRARLPHLGVTVDGLLHLVLPEAVADGLPRWAGPEDGVAIGCSGVIVTAARLPDAAQEARWALGVAEAGNRRLARYGDPTALLLPRSPIEAQCLVSRVLGPLISHDAEHGTAYVQTLRALLQRNRSWRLAAADLHVHKQTLAYRIRRIEQLTARGLVRTDHLAEWWVALLAHDLIAGRDPGGGGGQREPAESKR
jgi:purine catabolism regulator